MKNIKAQREEQRKKAEQEGENMPDLYRALFLSEAGKMVLKDLNIFCGGDEDSFNENPNTMAYMVGRQSIMVHIKKIMTKQNKK